MKVDLVAMAEEARLRVEEAQGVVKMLCAVASLRSEVEALGAVFEVKQTGASQFRIDLGFAVCPAPDAALVLADPAPKEAEAVDDERAAGVSEVEAVDEGGFEVAASEPEPEPEPEAEPASESDGLIRGPWSAAEEARAVSMMVAGRTANEIAGALNRALPAVKKRLTDLRRGTGRPSAARKRRLVPGKYFMRPAATPAPDAAPKPAACAKAVPFAERPGVASLPTRAAPDAPSVPVSGIKGERPYAERMIIAHLNALGNAKDWTPARDLELVEEQCKGANLSVVAVELGVGYADAMARWRALNTAIGDPEHQARLCRILRERAA